MIIQFDKDDLLQRRERKDKRVSIWIKQEWLVDNTDVSENYLRTTARKRYRSKVSKSRQQQQWLPDMGYQWRYGKQYRCYYYDYDRLPEEVQEQLPAKTDLYDAYEQAIEDGIHTNLRSQMQQHIQEHYRQYLRHYRCYTDQQAQWLAQAAAALHFCHLRTTMGKRPATKNLIYKQLAAVVQDLDISYLPRNYRRLKEKIAAMRADTPLLDIIDLPRKGNTNSRFAEAERATLKAMLLKMRSMPQNYSNAHISRKLRYELAPLKDMRIPSESWCNSVLAEYNTKFLTATGRWGSGRKADIMKSYLPMRDAMYAGECWQVDGTRINLIGHLGEDKKDRFLYIIAIQDVYSKDYVGWHFCYQEDNVNFTQALKMAVQNTGHLPYELVTDKFPGHNTPQIETLFDRLRSLGTTVTITSKKTGKATVERMFGVLQSVFMMDSPYYYGEGVQSRRDAAHRSPEYIRKITKLAKSEGWNFEKAWDEANSIVERYKTTKFSTYSRKRKHIEKSPAQLYKESEKPNIIPLEIWDILELFGTEKRVKINHAGLIRTEIHGVVYFYRVDEYEVISQHQQVRLRYDLEDLRQVYLYEDSTEMNRGFLCVAVEQQLVERYGPYAKMNEMGKAKERQAYIERRRKEELEKEIEQVAEYEVMMGGKSAKDRTAAAEDQWIRDWAYNITDKTNSRLPELQPINQDNEEDKDIDPSSVRKMY